MSVWTIYWLTRLEPFSNMLKGMANNFSVAACAVLILGGGFAVLVSLDDQTPDRCVKRVKAAALTALAVWSVSFVCDISRALLPSKTDLAIIFAGNWAANSEEVRALPDNVVKTMNKFMTDYIGDDKKEAKP